MADDYRNGHATAINGVNDILPLSMNNSGELVFEDALGMNAERTFKSYGWNFYSTTKPDLGTLQGSLTRCLFNLNSLEQINIAPF